MKSGVGTAENAAPALFLYPKKPKRWCTFVRSFLLQETKKRCGQRDLNPSSTKKSSSFSAYDEKYENIRHVKVLQYRGFFVII